MTVQYDGHTSDIAVACRRTGAGAEEDDANLIHRESLSATSSRMCERSRDAFADEADDLIAIERLRDQRSDDLPLHEAERRIVHSSHDEDVRRARLVAPQVIEDSVAV